MSVSRLQLLVLTLAWSHLGLATAQAEKPRLLIDADTANEIDDLFAITRLLRQDAFEVVALNSTQWLHYLSPEHMARQGIEAGTSTVEASQRFNDELCELLGSGDLPRPLGAALPMGRPWGGRQPRDSAAARAIIREALTTPDGERLHVVCLGAMTNLASAVSLEPGIVDRVSAYVLGFRIDASSGVWNKATFNVRRDLNAADYLLDTEGLPLTVMPGNVAEKLVFRQDETFLRHRRLGALGDYLTRRWNGRFETFDTWIMWDLALVEAILRPDLATFADIETPPENTRRIVRVGTAIDAAAMQADYWRAVLPAED